MCETRVAGLFAPQTSFLRFLLHLLELAKSMECVEEQKSVGNPIFEGIFHTVSVLASGEDVKDVNCLVTNGLYL